MRQRRVRAAAQVPGPASASSPPSARAALHRRRLVLGDIIVAIDGKTVKNAGDLYRQLDKKEVGDQLDVEVRDLW